MSSEYIQLIEPEVDYGRKNMLQSELGLLNSVKLFNNYKDLRKQELKLKIALKKSISEIKMQLFELEKKLPKIQEPITKKLKSKPLIFKSESRKESKIHTSNENNFDKKKENPLEDEIENIKKRLDML